MNKTELIAAIAEQAEISKKDAEKALKAFVDVVTEQLKEGEKVQLVGFGTFEQSDKPVVFSFQLQEKEGEKIDEIGQIFKSFQADQTQNRSQRSM